MKFGRLDLTKTTYNIILDAHLLNPVPIDEINQVYETYCLYKNFKSVMPLVPGRFTIPGTEVLGYYDQNKLIAWSMYRIWDSKSIVIDHHAWDYSNPKLRIGLRSLENECALYRDRGYEFMYFESVEPYMLSMQGFELLGPFNGHLPHMV
jgi:hypothetical protein